MKSSKGGEWEREISKRLSLWWSGGDRDDLFWRTSQSGGRATQRKKRGLETANSTGDIAAMDPLSQPFTDHFSIELKRGYTNEIKILQDVDSLTKRSEPFLLKCWNQAERDREASGRSFSLLLFKRDRRREMILFERKLLSRFQEIFGDAPTPVISIKYSEKIPVLVLMRLSDWMEWVDADALREELL